VPKQIFSHYHVDASPSPPNFLLLSFRRPNSQFISVCSKPYPYKTQNITSDSLLRIPLFHSRHLDNIFLVLSQTKNHSFSNSISQVFNTPLILHTHFKKLSISFKIPFCISHMAPKLEIEQQRPIIQQGIQSSSTGTVISLQSISDSLTSLDSIFKPNSSLRPPVTRIQILLSTLSSISIPIVLIQALRCKGTPGNEKNDKLAKHAISFPTIVHTSLPSSLDLAH